MGFTLIKEFKKSTPLVEIECGTALSVYISLISSPVTFNGKLFLPEPKVKVKLPKQSGGFGEELCEVTIPTQDSQHAGIMTLASWLVEPRAVPITTIKIYNLIEYSPEDVQVVYLYDGVLDKDTRFPEGQQGKLRMDFMPEHLLYLSEATLGRRTDGTCDRRFGGLGCDLDVDTFFGPGEYWSSPTFPHFELIRKAAMICTIDAESTGRRVTLDIDPAVHPGADNRTVTGQSKGWWNRGYLEKDGLRIMIVDWRWDSLSTVGTDAFILSRLPPRYWDGAQVILHPGCTKTPEACAKRLNSDRFAGLGYGTPAYNPVTESHDF